MKFCVFLGLTIVFSRNFFEFVGGQIPFPVPGVLPLQGMAPAVTPFPIRRKTAQEKDFHSSDHSLSNSEEIRSDFSKTAVNEATSTVVPKTTIVEETTDGPTTEAGNGSSESDSRTKDISSFELVYRKWIASHWYISSDISDLEHSRMKLE